MALHILAAKGDDGLMKVIFIVAMIVLWGIGALVTTVKKAAEERKKRQRMILEQQRTSGYYRPQPASPAYNIPPPPPPAPKGKRRRKQQPAPVQPQPVEEGESMVHVQLATQAVEQPKAPAAPEAHRIARLIHRGDSLRAAFILSEVLARPVSQRDSG